MYPFMGIASQNHFLIKVCNRGFNTVLQMLTKQCNHLDIVKEGNLRHLMTGIKPQVILSMQEHQDQGPH